MGRNFIDYIKMRDELKVLNNKEMYSSNIISIDKEKKIITIATPLRKMKKMYIFKGFTYKGIVINENHGLLHFDFELLEYEDNSPVIKVESEIKNKQRREFFRIKVVNEVIAYETKSLKYFNLLNKDSKSKLPTYNIKYRDLSLGGVGLISSKKIKTNTILVLNLKLEEINLWCEGIVKNVREIDEGFIVGVCFQELKEHQKKILNKFIIEKQRKMLNRM